MIALLLVGCYPSKPRKAFVNCPPPSPPDYTDLFYWAAHPDKRDSADVVPSSEMINGQDKARADVFYLHPTTYLGSVGENKWNAPVDNVHLNRETDKVAVRSQATIFNRCYRIFAPRYRQAHYKSYFTSRKKDGNKALELAYRDVKKAFEYYLDHHNDGRPIVIAGHSQGSTHGTRLLQEYFDGEPLADQLVVAYLPGMLVHDSQFDDLEACESPESTGCICSWRTFKYGHYPKVESKVSAQQVIVTNPLSWTTMETHIPGEQNPGSVLRDFYKGVVPDVAGAKISDGFVWTEKPQFKGSFWIWTKNYHPGDFNLYYQSVRENACKRLDAYLNTPMTEKPEE